MEIRPAEPSDIPAIISLLKLSLGEALLPKSEAYWRWKHVENPFGESPVLVAVEEDVLIGVRAFMRWDWIQGNHVYNAVRAVDTATHPNYQGKGIFRKLTMKLLEDCKEGGTHFVFNTPNGQSRPGYLKMGWQDAGRLAVQVAPVGIRALIPGASGRRDDAAVNTNVLPDDDVLARLLEQDRRYSANLNTHVSTHYLRWRYVDVPVVKYQILFHQSAEGSTLVFGRLKESRFGTEFRITDVFADRLRIEPAVKRTIRNIAAQAGAAYITCSGTLRHRFSVGIALKRGPITTIRPLAWQDSSMLMNFKAWAPSLGDLELF